MSGASMGVLGSDSQVASVVFECMSKKYSSSAGVVDALSDISLSIPKGRICGFIGRSGAGKSSLIRTINRLERPTTGRVLIDGTDIGTLDEEKLISLRRRVGMIFQHFNLLSAKTVFDNVALPLRVAGASAKQCEERVTELLGLVGLEGKHSTYPGRLSGGQKQRVGIARALVHHPDILLCDEATSALDPETTQSILSLLKNINRKLGLTVILITHEMGVIREICDEVVVLERGRIVEAGKVWKVFGKPQHAATMAMLQPLEHSLPDDIRCSLSQEKTAGSARVIELAFTGQDHIEPDMQRIVASLGAKTRLLHGGVDRIQGHVHGRLILSAGSGGPSAEALVQQKLCNNAKEIGYVPATL